MLVFASSRTVDLMGIALRLGGFITHPIIGWCFGSGFPKATNLGKKVDLKFGNEREVVGKKKQRGRPAENAPFEKNTSKHEVEILTKGTSEWEGWFYGRQSLKPALEPILMVQKPPEGKMVDNVLKWGTGGVNIDGSRVEHNEECKMMKAQTDDEVMTGGGKYGQAGRRVDVLELKPDGRFPANLILENCPEVKACFPETKSGALKPYKENHQNVSSYKFEREKTFEQDANSGNASRFFKNIDITEEDIYYDRLIYQAKASKHERQKGCEDIYLLKNGTPEEVKKEIENLLDIAK